jgi:glycosyltransferase involved in cell wall biosynthesis
MRLEALSRLDPEYAVWLDILVAARGCDEESVRSALPNVHSIHVVNGYTHEQLAGLLKDVHLGIVPVLWEDNLPQVAIEMVALGVPILCSDLGGASELCDSELFRFRGGDESDFLNHLKQLIKERTLLDEYWLHHRYLTTMRMHLEELKEEYGFTKLARVRPSLAVPKVSVLLPVYNVERYLRTCLDSILDQSLKDVEVICVSDGTTDGSLGILREYERKDPRIVVLTQKNRGAGAARNTGLSVARGEYLAFLDADDFFEPDMLESAYSHGVATGADIIQFLTDRFDNETEKFAAAPWVLWQDNLPSQNPFSWTDIPEKIFNLGNKWAWDKLYKRSFVEERSLRFQEIRTSNDMYFVCAAYVKANKIAILHRVLAHQRVNLSESLSVTREKSWDCFYQALIALKDELVRSGVYPKVERSYVNWALDFSLWQLQTMKDLAHVKAYELLQTRGVRGARNNRTR